MASFVKAIRARLARIQDINQNSSGPGNERIAEIFLSRDNVGLDLTICSGDGSEKIVTVGWNSIIEVSAFKRDCFAYDLMCLQLRSGDRLIELSEDEPGWTRLLDELPQQLTGFPSVDEWWEKVAQPPFATNRTVLWELKRV